MRAWKKSPFQVASPSRLAFPPLLNLGWDDTAAVELEGEYDLYRTRIQNLKRTPLSVSEFTIHDKQFLDKYKTVRLSELTEIESLALPLHPIHTYRIPRVCSVVLSDRLLSNICEDLVPDIGLYAFQRVFGPLELTPPSKELAGAVLSFSPLLSYFKTPLGQLSTENRKFTKSMRMSMSAMATTPCALWNIDPQTHTLRPAIPIKKEFIPNNFKLQEIPSNTKMLIARIFKTEEGWHAGTCLFLPSIDAQYIFERLQREWLRLNRVAHKLYWEDLLCYRSELLYRSCISWCYNNNKNEIKHITYRSF